MYISFEESIMDILSIQYTWDRIRDQITRVVLLFCYSLILTEPVLSIRLDLSIEKVSISEDNEESFNHEYIKYMLEHWHSFSAF